jgi:predicted amidohydrolase YtcJ
MAARLTAYVVVGIVAATLIAGLIVGAQREDADGPVDLIIHNATVYTGSGSGATAEAVAIRGNQILRVGSEREINRLRRPQTLVVDARGAAVLPGFNDSHVRFLEGGLALQQLDVSTASTVQEIQQQVREWAAANPDHQWIVGRGWSDVPAIDGQTPRQVLDAAERRRPVQLVSLDGRSAWVNSAALRAAGITKKTADPVYGRIVRDARGEATGLLRGDAMALVARTLPPVTPEQRTRALQAAVEEAHKAGVTSVHDVAGGEEALDTYAQAAHDGELQVRLYAALPLAKLPDDPELDRLRAVTARYADDPGLRAGPVYLDVDAPVATGMAALLEPYSGSDAARAPRFDPDALNRTVRLMDAKGWQVMLAASGDGASHAALNAFEHAARSNPAPPRGRRHRLESVELVTPEDTTRFASYGVIASMQPGSLSDPDLFERLLGPSRAGQLLPYRRLADARARLAFGSDWPASPMNPLLAIYEVATRAAANGDDPTPLMRMTLTSALAAYTSGGAWASFDEQRKGTLEPGMLADLVVLSDNIFDLPPERLLNVSVEATIFDGKIVYRRGQASTN